MCQCVCVGGGGYAGRGHIFSDFTAGIVVLAQSRGSWSVWFPLQLDFTHLFSLVVSFVGMIFFSDQFGIVVSSE